MKNTKHTPGPWTARDYGHENIIHIEHETGSAIAQIGGPTTNMDLAEANARLIASAPELLEVLGDMLARFADHEQYDETGEDTEAINAARAAIRKATGQH